MIVDTASNPRLGVDLSTYFKTKGVIRFESGKTLDFLNTMTCFPRAIEGNITGYRCLNLQESPIKEVSSGQEITFDFQHKYQESLLVHQQFGGGLNSIDLCGVLEVGDEIWLEALASKSSLGNTYSAIHVRHSDYKTNWQPQFESLSKRVSKSTVLIATDSSELINEAKQTFPRWHIVGADEIGRTAKLDANAHALIDLALLADAEEFYILKLSETNVAYSGFSLLAKYLWTVRKVRKSGLVGLFKSNSLFLDFHTSRSGIIRLLFFFLYYLPRIIRHSRGSDIFPAISKSS